MSIDVSVPASGNAPGGPGSASSIADIVDSFEWQDGATLDAVPAQDAPSPSIEGTSPAAEPAPSDAQTTTEKPPLYSADELRKLSPNEIQSPKFDWSRVPPEAEPLLKAAQAVLTRGHQALAAEREKLKAGQQPKPSDTEPSSDEERIEQENRAIVERSLKSMGVDPEVIREMQREAVLTQALQLAEPAAPEYVSDNVFQQAVNRHIAEDPALVALVHSDKPETIALAIELASNRIKVAASRSRDEKVRALEAELETALTEVRKHKEDLNRQPASAAAGRSPAGAPKAPARDVRDIVDEEWPKGLGSLI